MEWQPVAITGAYLAGVVYCVSAAWDDEPSGWQQDLANAASAVLWPVVAVWCLFVGVFQGLRR